jgi:hypothetical protein
MSRCARQVVEADSTQRESPSNACHPAVHSRRTSVLDDRLREERPPSWSGRRKLVLPMRETDIMFRDT